MSAKRNTTDQYGRTHGQQYMTCKVDSKRHSRSEASNFPTSGREASEEDHDADERNGARIHPLEALEDLRHLLEEVAVLGLLRRGTPFHVDAEHVGEERQIEME